MCGKGSNTTTNTSTSSADPQAAQAYRDLLTRAQGVASTPYQAYTGELTAPVNAQQQFGIGNINQNANFAQPYVQQAAGIAQNAATPLTQQQIQQYQNPYTQNVVDATQAQFNNQNAQQRQGVIGNEIASGALGGNRVGVERANLANQQQLAQAPVIAGLYDKSYQQGLATANQQFQQNPLAASGAIANYGISGQGAALSGAGAQLGAGTLQQQTQQQADTANYGQYAQAQAYPYQQAQWLAGVNTGVGSNLGGTSSGSTTGPPPNQTAQYLGAGLTAASMFLNRGGRVNGYASGGVVPHMADGGMPGTPWSQGVGWIPQMNIHGGSGAPHASAPSLPQTPAFDATKFAQGLTGLGNGVAGKLAGPSYGGGNVFTDAYGGSSSSPLEGLTAADYGEGYARGGVVGYADGGSPIDYTDPAWDTPDSANFAGRFGPAESSPLGQMTRGQGIALASRNGTPSSIPEERPIYDDGQGPVRLYGQRPEGNPAAKGVAPITANDDDEETTPPSANPTQGRLQGVAGYKPPYEIGPSDYTAPQQEKSSGFGLGLLSPNAKTGLLAAGLGMLANRSPFLGTAIGEGGQSGLAAYGSAEEHDRKVAAEAQKLSLEAKKAANEQAHTTFTTNETARHNQATEKQAAVNSDRTKYSPAGSVLTKDGAYHPLVLEQTSGKIVDAVTGKPPSADDKIQDKGTKGGPISEDDAKSIAEYYVKTGDNSRLNGLGITSAARQAVQKHIREAMDREKVTPEEMGTRVAEFAGRKAGQRTLGTMEAKMGSAAFEAEGAIKQARGVIERLPRTSYLPINQLIEGYSNKTLNPDQTELYGRTQAIVNTYAAVMARGANVTTDSSRHHAIELLKTAGDPATYNRMLDTMLQEIEMAKHSPAKMREFYRQQYGVKAAPDDGTVASTPPAFTPPAGAVPRQWNGKTIYFDPATKQPIPGQ